MNHNDTVKQSFKKQAEKFAAYHISKILKLCLTIGGYC